MDSIYIAVLHFGVGLFFIFQKEVDANKENPFELLYIKFSSC